MKFGAFGRSYVKTSRDLPLRLAADTNLRAPSVSFWIWHTFTLPFSVVSFSRSAVVLNRFYDCGNRSICLAREHRYKISTATLTMKVTTLLLVLTATLSGFAQATVRGANEADHTAHRKLDSGKGKGKGKGQRMMMMTTSGPECPKDPFPPPAAGYCPLPGKYEPKENVFDQRKCKR